MSWPLHGVDKFKFGPAAYSKTLLQSWLNLLLYFEFRNGVIKHRFYTEFRECVE